MARRGGSSKAVVGQKGRSRMSREKSNELEKRYPRVGATPGTKRMNRMARDLGLNSTQVKSWFTNKRAKVRTEMAKKELQTENNLLRAKNQQLEAIIHDLMASNELLKSQLMVMESRQRDVKNKEILESSRPVGFTAAGTSSAAPAATVEAPTYPHRHLLQGTGNEPAAANMLNNYGYGPVAAPAETVEAPAYPRHHLLQGTVNEPAAANMLNNYGYGPVAAPAYPHLQGTGNEPAAANMVINNGYVPVAAPAYPHLQGTGNEAVSAITFNNYGYGPVSAAAPAYPRRHLLQGAVNEAAAANTFSNYGYRPVSAASPAYPRRHLLQGAVNEAAAANTFSNYGYGPVSAAYPRRHLLQRAVNEPAAANMLINNGYGTVAAAPVFDIDAYDEVAMINNSYDYGGYYDDQEYRVR